MKLSTPQRALLSRLVAQRRLTCEGLTLTEWKTAAALEHFGLAERVLGELLPTKKGDEALSALHDLVLIDHVCSICTKAHRTKSAAQRCATRHVPMARPAARARRKRKHKCISCGAVYDSKDEARACLDSHW